MSDVKIPFGGNAKDTAVLLLAAAEDLGLDAATAVRTSTGFFVVDSKIADEAGLGEKPKEKPAKKAPAKKAAKKAPAKKATAKKVAAKKAETKDAAPTEAEKK